MVDQKHGRDSGFIVEAHEVEVQRPEMLSGGNGCEGTLLFHLPPIPIEDGASRVEQEAPVALVHAEERRAHRPVPVFDRT